MVRVLDRHGFGTVEPGQLLAGTADGATSGLIYNGVLDATAVPLAVSAVQTAGTADAHVGDHEAMEAGLACSGGARLLGHPLPAELAAALGEALERGVPAALVATADGAALLVLTGQELGETHGTLGGAEIDEEATGAVHGLLRRGATATERTTVAGQDVLIDLWVPVPQVLVVGSGAIGDALLAQAELLGWSAQRVTELDEARAAVADFGDADVLVLLDHAPRFDALLVDAVRSGRGFIGALGSRHTQRVRRDRLQRGGLTAEQLARLRGPVGLDIGARSSAETAVSVVGEVIAARSGRSGSALAGTDGRIGG